MSNRVYVFDLDDTLYLERDYVRSGFAHIGKVASARYGVEGVGDYAWSLFKQGVRGNTFDTVVSRFALPTIATELFIAEYRGHMPHIQLEPDSAQFLNQLPSDAIGTALITDGNPVGQWSKIRSLGLEQRFDIILVTGDHGSAWTKPSPLAFRRVEDHFSTINAEFVYFGDNPAKDFQAPSTLGWRTVRLRRPLGLHYSVPNNIPVHWTLEAFPPPVDSQCN